MKNRWFKPEETVTMACPLSVGQAEAGRYTYCVANKCMAWVWYVPDGEERRSLEVGKEVPEGWSKASSNYEVDGIEFFDIMKTPTHGRCGMVKDQKSGKE